MNITQANIDDLNATLTVTIDRSDFMEKVNEMLTNYRKNANIPGFRKGQVPMGMIKKQYEKPLIFDEVNQLLQTNVDNYLKENKISILGNPVPKVQEELNWDAEQLNFEFDLGIAPQFDLALNKLKITDYKIKVAEEDVEKYIKNFRTRFGQMSEEETVDAQTYLEGAFNEVDADGNKVEGGFHHHATLVFDELKAQKEFKGKKVEDKVVVKVQDLYKKSSDLAQVLGMTVTEAEELDKLLEFKINKITKIVPAEINQELFDKVYGEGAVDSEEAFRTKIKEESEKMYQNETDRQLLNDVIESLLESTSFDLPEGFLKKWIQFSNEQADTEEKAAEVYENAQKGLRYQLIEGKLAEQFEIQVTQEDIAEQALASIKQQMAMYGPLKMEDEQLKQIAMSSIQNNEEEYRKVADQAFSMKMLDVFKENVTLEPKELSFDDFVKAVTENKEEK